MHLTTPSIIIIISLSTPSIFDHKLTRAHGVKLSFRHWYSINRYFAWKNINKLRVWHSPVTLAARFARLVGFVVHYSNYARPYTPRKLFAIDSNKYRVFNLFFIASFATVAVIVKLKNNCGFAIWSLVIPSMPASNMLKKLSQKQYKLYFAKIYQTSIRTNMLLTTIIMLKGKNAKMKYAKKLNAKQWAGITIQHILTAMTIL